MLYQDYRRRIFQQHGEDLPADWEGWFGLSTNVVHHTTEIPPFRFWIEVGRQDGGGLELVQYINRWALCDTMSGNEFMGNEPNDFQCVRDFWDAETRDYTLTEADYADEIEAAREAEGEQENDDVDDEGGDAGDEDGDDSNDPSIHGFQQHLGFEVDPRI